MRKNIFKGLALSLAAINVAIPYLKRHMELESNGKIISMDGPIIEQADLAYYIIPGIVPPPYPEYNQFITGYNKGMHGHCFFVDYGKDHYSPKNSAKLVVHHAVANHIKEIRLLTISIGSQLVPFIATELANTAISCRIWAIDPCMCPNYLWPNVRKSLRISMPFAIILKIILGWVGQQRIIPRNNALRSYAEICEQAKAITYTDYTHKMTILPKNTTVAGFIISQDDEFVNAHNAINEDVEDRYLWGLKHCRFAENWRAYLEALDDLGFYSYP